MEISNTQFFLCHIPKEWQQYFVKAEGVYRTEQQTEVLNDINAENRIRLRTPSTPWGKQWIVHTQHRKNATKYSKEKYTGGVDLVLIKPEEIDPAKQVVAVTIARHIIKGTVMDWRENSSALITTWGGMIDGCPSFVVYELLTD